MSKKQQQQAMQTPDLFLYTITCPQHVKGQPVLIQLSLFFYYTNANNGVESLKKRRLTRLISLHLKMTNFNSVKMTAINVFLYSKVYIQMKFFFPQQDLGLELGALYLLGRCSNT
jgi:hypothetical protein